MTNNLIKFKQERDFGDIFNVTFSFIKQEYKRLGTVLLFYVVPLLIISAIFGSLYSVKVQEITQNSMPQSGTANPFNTFSAMGSMIGFVLLYLLATIISSNMLLCTVLCYIKLYVKQNTEGFTTNDVWREVMKNFGRLLIASIVVGIVVVVGFMLCVIPGIYLGVALSLVFAIMVFEEISFSESFKRSLNLVKSKWWFTFGIFIVTGIIIYILSILLSIPAMALGFKTMFYNLKQPTDAGMNFSVGFHILNSVTSVITQLFSIILIVMTAFLYYSYVEEKEKPSLLEKIDQINDNE